MWWLDCVVIAIGTIVGTCIEKYIRNRKTVYGCFSMEQTDPENEPEQYSVHVMIPTNKLLLDKKRIILLRDDSRK
jgi:hypothetical protein